jgi:hypothetical protein
MLMAANPMTAWTAVDGSMDSTKTLLLKDLDSMDSVTL